MYSGAYIYLQWYVVKILSIHYTNIGPFQDQTITIKPKNGSYIIKAPIGSGKSVLFFDGPIFALYRKSSRPLLNMKSQKGEVVIEFEHEGMCYCIQRILTKTKTWESIKSKLRQKLSSWQQLNDFDPIVHIGSVQAFELPHGYEMVEFKNETDLQKLLDDLLPRKEVLLGTYFLMQDSTNIFELPPQERLNIFKSVFDLLGIDESKEKIGEEKREISAMIKARSDVSWYDTKLQNSLKQILSLRGSVQEMLRLYEWEHLADERRVFINEQQLLIDKIMIEHFTLPKLFDTQVIYDAIASLQERYHRLQTTQDITYKSLREQQLFIQELQKKSEWVTQKIHHIEQLLSVQQTLNYEDIQRALLLLQEQQSQLWNEYQSQQIYSILWSLTLQHSQDIFGGILWSDFPTVYRVVQHYINLWKEYKYRFQSFVDKKQLIEQQLTQLWPQILQSQQSLANFQKVASEQSLFFCDKIEGNCPYVDLINTSIAKKNQEQLTTLTAHHQVLLKQQWDLQVQREEIQNNAEYQQLEHDLNLLIQVIKQLDRKWIEATMQTWNDFELKMKSSQQQLNRVQEQHQALLQQKEQLVSLQTEQLSIQEQYHNACMREKELKQEWEQSKTLLSSLPSLWQLHNDTMTLQQFVKYVEQWAQVISDYKENILAIKQLKQKEKMLSDLYTVFSKELLLLVIQSNLPKIQDLMNAYLSQTVDYQLNMDIDKKSATTDTLELFVKIIDQHGDRQVESLSGGQKVILKLVWMIAISFVTNAPMLFLDETINNLDGDTVAKVADMITNFIKTKWPNFQFYVITHSQQIQEMGIWDGIVEL